MRCPGWTLRQFPWTLRRAYGANGCHRTDGRLHDSALGTDGRYALAFGWNGCTDGRCIGGAFGRLHRAGCGVLGTLSLVPRAFGGADRTLCRYGRAEGGRRHTLGGPRGAGRDHRVALRRNARAGCHLPGTHRVLLRTLRCPLGAFGRRHGEDCGPPHTFIGTHRTRCRVPGADRGAPRTGGRPRRTHRGFIGARRRVPRATCRRDRANCHDTRLPSRGGPLVLAPTSGTESRRHRRPAHARPCAARGDGGAKEGCHSPRKRHHTNHFTE